MSNSADKYAKVYHSYLRYKNIGVVYFIIFRGLLVDFFLFDNK